MFIDSINLQMQPFDAIQLQAVRGECTAIGHTARQRVAQATAVVGCCRCCNPSEGAQYQ